MLFFFTEVTVQKSPRNSTLPKPPEAKCSPRSRTTKRRASWLSYQQNKTIRIKPPGHETPPPPYCMPLWLTCEHFHKVATRHAHNDIGRHRRLSKASAAVVGFQVDEPGAAFLTWAQRGEPAAVGRLPLAGGGSVGKVYRRCSFLPDNSNWKTPCVDLTNSLLMAPWITLNVSATGPEADAVLDSPDFFSSLNVWEAPKRNRLFFAERCTKL